MKFTSTGAALLAAALAACTTPNAHAPVAGPTTEPSCREGSVRLERVELLFGLVVKDTGRISEDAWRHFLETEVTPRFPEGLTALDGYGQWRFPSDGTIARIDSKVLLIWYAPAADANARIEAIRDAYKARFRQVSVMRVDGSDCVSF